MGYIGAPIISTNFVLDQYTATAGQTVFTLTQNPASNQSVIVGIDGVIQEPGTAYTVSGTTLTFTSGVPLNSRVFAIHLGVRGTVTTPAAGSVGFTSLDTTLNGSMVQSVYAEYLTSADFTTVIPADDTIPQNTEGDQVMTATITPRSATNKMRIRFRGTGSCSVADTHVSIALFKDSVANALTASHTTVDKLNYALPFLIEYEEAAGDTSARTYKIRMGPNAITSPVRLNGSGSARFFGGVARATLVIEEIKA